MTPKEKADSLCMSYIMNTDIDGDSPGAVRVIAKQCALIAVDEVMKQKPSEPRSYTSTMGYWQEVKTEIEKL